MLSIAIHMSRTLHLGRVDPSSSPDAAHCCPPHNRHPQSRRPCHAKRSLVGEERRHLTTFEGRVTRLGVKLPGKKK
jgi:hypothetical protein